MGNSKKSSRDGRSHRVVALIGCVDASGRKHLLTMQDSDDLFPSFTFLAERREGDTPEQSLDRGLNRACTDLLKSFGLENRVNYNLVESDNRRKDGAHKFYAIGQLKSPFVPTTCHLVAMPMEQVIELLAIQHHKPGTDCFIDTVLNMNDHLKPHLPVAAKAA